MTYFVASFYAGDLKNGWVRGAHSSKEVAEEHRLALEARLGKYIVVRVYEADHIPPDVRLFV